MSVVFFFLFLAVDPHVATLLGMTVVVFVRASARGNLIVIARLGTSRGNLIPSAETEQGRPKVNLPLRSVILSVTKDLLRDYPF